MNLFRPWRLALTWEKQTVLVFDCGTGRGAGKLPGCWRRRDATAGDRSVPHYQLGPERAHDTREHLWWHHALRHHRTRSHRCRRVAQPQNSSRHSSSRYNQFHFRRIQLLGNFEAYR